MKKILIALFALISFYQSFGQSAGNDTTQYIYYRFTYGNALDRYWAKKVLLIPADTIYSKDGVAMKDGTLYLGDGTKWNQVTGGGGGGTDSAIAALYGLKEVISGTVRYLYVDTFAIQSRARSQKIADSLSTVFNTSLSLKKDKSDSAVNSGSYTTRGWLYHVIDSLSGITDFTDYHSTGATGIPLLVVSTSGSHTGVNIPKIRDSTVTIIAGDSGVTIATHDSVGANALQTKYRTDTMRNRIDTALDNKMKNYGGAPGQLQGTYAGIPAATSYPTGTTYIAQDSGFHYVDTGSGASMGWKRINGSGSGNGGTIGGTAAAGQVAYGSATNTIKTESPFTYNETTNTLNSDSVTAKAAVIDATTATSEIYPLRVISNFSGGYSGMQVQNVNSGGSAATELGILNDKGFGWRFRALSSNFASGSPVLAINGTAAAVFRCDSCDVIGEIGSPGGAIRETYHIFSNYPHSIDSFEYVIGSMIGGQSWDYRNHGSKLYVMGDAKIRDGLTLNDQGIGYALLRAGNFKDSIGYQQGVGYEIRGIIKNNPDNMLMRLDSVGRMRLPFYTNTSLNSAITNRFLGPTDGQGNIKLVSAFDTASGTQNGTAVLYWGPNGYPTSNDSKLSFNYNTNVLDVRSTAGGMLKADSAALYHGYLRLADYGGTYAYVAADNYQLRTTYVEGVNLRFRVVNATNPRLDAFEIDSTGDIRWLVQPKSATSADSVMMIASNGIVHKMRIADLGASITQFSQTADGTVTNTNTTTSIFGTGTGSQTIPANTLTVGKKVIVRGFGYISTDASVPTLTITFKNSSSNAGNAVGALLTASMNNVPIEWDYEGTVRSTGASGSIEMNGWFSINGTKVYISTAGAFLLDTTTGQTFDISALWGTASTNNTIVTKQNSITVQ